MDEIKRLQQLAGIITEIKVNNPTIIDYVMGEYGGEPHKFEGDDLMFSLEKALHSSNSLEDFIKKFTYGVTDETNSLSKQDIEKIKRWYQQNSVKEVYKNIEEDVSDFHIGQSSEQGGRKTTVTDIDPTTQSVTWSVKKEVDDSTIYKDLSDLITKFEKVQLKDFHSRPKLIQLVKDLKSIRNRFSRTIVKEDLHKLKENLVGILNEIKVNTPGIKPRMTYDDALKSSELEKKIKNYVDINYPNATTWGRYGAVTKGHLKKFISSYKKDTELLSLINNYVRFGNQFSKNGIDEIKVNQPQLKKFNDYMHILDFFGGELPQSYRQAQSEALRAGYDLTLQEYTVADQNSTFSEIKVNNPQRITIGTVEDDGLGNPLNWIEIKSVLKHLLPIFPQREQEIKDWVEEWNDYGVEGDELETTTSELKKHFLEQNG